MRYEGRLRRIGNPLRAPALAPASLACGLLGAADLLRLAAYSARVGLAAPDRLRLGADVSAAEAFADAGLSPGAVGRFLRPFLSGVLLEDQLQSSRRYVDLVWRSFVRGASVLPATGIGAVAAQLAGQLPPRTLRLNTTVSAVRPLAVDVLDETLHARAVVVAADPRTAASWLGFPEPRMRSVVTYYHRCEHPVLGESVIVLDGDRAGPIVNSVELTAALPQYAPRDSTLISTSVLDAAVPEAVVLRQLQRLYGVSTSAWELVSRVVVDDALPAYLPGQPMAQLALAGGVFVAGDHRATPSLQGAMASGARAARAVLESMAVPSGG